jgi:hypothetical protein
MCSKPYIKIIKAVCKYKLSIYENVIPTWKYEKNYNYKNRLGTCLSILGNFLSNSSRLFVTNVVLFMCSSFMTLKKLEYQI